MPKSNIESYSYDVDELEKIIFNGKRGNLNENKIVIIKEIKKYAKMIMDIDNKDVKEITVINNNYILNNGKNLLINHIKQEKNQINC